MVDMHLSDQRIVARLAIRGKIEGGFSDLLVFLELVRELRDLIARKDRLRDLIFLSE